MKVAVGMSGGVDSSVAAWLLRAQGHEVVGVCMALWDGAGDAAPTGRHACYGPDEAGDIQDAQAVCQSLGVPFHVFDCAREYKETVLAYFKAEYAAGRTPNPCVKCNHLMKFGFLPAMARRSGLDFDRFATGHYARVRQSAGRWLLLKGADAKKDQSYFLHRLDQGQLAQSLFPLGELDKEEVRRLAADHQLPTAAKRESQDFYCGDYADLLGFPSRDGAIVDKGGNVLGTHRGVWNFTPGQRKGLGVAAAEPLYVLGCDARSNTVTVGRKADALSSVFTVSNLNWIAFERLRAPLRLTVKTRSTHPGAWALVEPLGAGGAKVVCDEPQLAVAPGQSAVFYDGDVVAGGGIIDNVHPTWSAP